MDFVVSKEYDLRASYLADRRTYAKRNLRLRILYLRFVQMNDISCAFRNSSDVVYSSRNYFTSRNELWNSCFLFYLREMEFYRYLDMWSPVARSRKNRFLYRQHRDHFLSIISSSIPTVNIGISPSISQFRWHLCFVSFTFHGWWKRYFAYL